MNFNAELVGKKRCRRRTKRSKGEGAEEPVIRKKNAITKCEHTDAKYYAKGMCTNCYFKFGREKRATCCPDKPKYAKGVCHNCYMKKYSKDKRQQNKEARKQTKKDSASKDDVAQLKLKRRVSAKDSIVSDFTAPTYITPPSESSPKSNALSEAKNV